MIVFRRRGTDSVDFFLEGPSCLEDRRVAGRDLNLLAGGGVSADARVAMAAGEGAEADQGDGLTGGQGIRNGSEDGIHGGSGGFLAEAVFGGDFLDQFCFVHDVRLLFHREMWVFLMRGISEKIITKVRWDGNIRMKKPAEKQALLLLFTA